MGLVALLEPVIQLILYVAYGVYVVFGLGICFAGGWYYSEIDGADKAVALVCVVAGLVMMVVGGIAIFGTNKKNWLLMFVVLFIDLALFVALLAGCMVAYVIAFEVTDPVTKAVHETFARTEARESGWETAVIPSFDHGGPKKCKDFQEYLVGKEVKQTYDQKPYAANCTKTYELAENHNNHAPAHMCVSCWSEFEYWTVEQIKKHLWPATYSIFGLLLSVVISICLNMWMIENCEPDDEDDDEDAPDKWTPEGIPKIASLALTALTMLMGLLLLIFGIVAHLELTKDDNCKSAGSDGCTNWAVIGVIILGGFFFLLGGLNIAAVLLGGFIGKLFMRILTIAWTVLALLLLIVGICFALVAGAITSINEQYDLNFDEIRAQANEGDDTICAKSMSDTDCKKKLRERTEDAFSTIMWVLLFTCCGFIVVMYLTLQAGKLFKNEEGDEDDEDDEGQE